MYIVQVRLLKEYRCKHLDVYIHKTPQMSGLVVVKCYCPQLLEIVRKVYVFLANMCFKVYKRVFFVFFSSKCSLIVFGLCIEFIDEKEKNKEILF